MVDKQYQFINRQTLQPPPPQMTIQTDASKTGWVAFATGAVWCSMGKTQRIIILELKAVYLALVDCNKKKKKKKKWYSSTPNGHYICPDISSEDGGTRNSEIIRISKEILMHLLGRNISIIGEYLPSKLNYIANHESQQKMDFLEWKLSPIYNFYTP